MERVHLIAAARPNFMKVAPLWRALDGARDFTPVLIHTGQHYDANMSEDFFRDLAMPTPNHHLNVGSGSHAQQTGGVMIAYEEVASVDRPDWLVVVGDVNSTAACAMVGAKLGLRIVHLEAGLRSRDRRMPEEVNRLVTDVLADVLWTPSPDADDNLLAEGIPATRMTRVGNIMIDSLVAALPRIKAERAPESLGLTPGNYGMVTLHRPSNVDDPAELARLVDLLAAAAARLPLVFPAHPRTRPRLEAGGHVARLEAAGVRLIEPQGYNRFIGLLRGAALALTDSGGIQEETTWLGIPCLTLRENTERPITVTQGTNRLVTVDTALAELDRALATDRATLPRPDRWDGHTAQRCVADLRARRSV